MNKYKVKFEGGQRTVKASFFETGPYGVTFYDKNRNQIAFYRGVIMVELQNVEC